MKGKLKNGFQYTINDKALESFEFMEVLSQAEDNPIHYVKTFEIILGKEQKEKLMNHLKEDGYTSAEKMTEALMEIIESSQQLKNSQSSPE